jgi:hypothetical protein
MTDDLQWWANLAQIISLPLAILALIVALAQWLWPKPNVPKIPLWILTGVAGLSLGILITSSAYRFSVLPEINGPTPTEESTVVASPTPTDNIVTIDSLSFEVYTITGTDGDEDVSRDVLNSHLSIANYEDDNTDYIFSSLIPDSGDYYTGLVFRFSAPQDLTEYSTFRVESSFDSPPTDLDINLVDIDNNRGYVLDLGSPDRIGEDINVQDNDSGTYVFEIPIANNFVEINDGEPPDKSLIREITFTTRMGGMYRFTITDIAFIR